MKNVVVFAAVLMTVGVFAGCLNTTPPRFTSVLEDTVIFDGTYHWAPIMRTDDQGNFLQNYTIDDPTAGLPRSFEAVLPFGGSQPVSGVVPNASGGPPTIFTVTWDDIQKSTDFGKTWTVSKRFVAENYPVVQDRYMTNGASLWVDEETNGVFVSQLYHEVPPCCRPPMSQCIELHKSMDVGVTWESIRPAHCWPSVIPWATLMLGDDQGIGDVVLQHIVTGPPAAGGLSPVTGALHGNFKNNVYICYSSAPEFTYGTGEGCVASFDGGKTFPQRGRPVKDPEVCEAMRAGRAAVTPDGKVTIPVGWEYTPIGVYGVNGWIIPPGFCDTPPEVFTSTDNTLSWSPHRYEEGGWINAEMNPAVVYGPDGKTGYLLFRSAADQQVYLLRTKDQFETWMGPPVRVSPKDLSLTIFTAMVAGDDGKIAMAYLGTRQPQEPGAWSGNASGNSHWNLFITTSFDAASDHPTFLTHQATPQEDPVQVGRVFPPFGYSSPLIGGVANLHNFISLTADKDGRLVVTFADGCNPRVGCSGDTDAGFWLKDRQGAVAILDRGESIRGKFLESLGLTAPPPKPHADNQL